MNNVPLQLLGVDEQSPTPIGRKLMDFLDPFGFIVISQYDQAVEAIRARIEEELSFDVINPKAWYLLGLAGGPVKNFVTAYINTSTAWNEPYNPAQYIKWENYFVDELGMSLTRVETYFRVLGELIKEKGIGPAIAKPAGYEPPKTPTMQELAVKLAVVGVGGMVVYHLAKRGLFGR